MDLLSVSRWNEPSSRTRNTYPRRHLTLDLMANLTLPDGVDLKPVYCRFGCLGSSGVNLNAGVSL